MCGNNNAPETLAGASGTSGEQKTYADPIPQAGSASKARERKGENSTPAAPQPLPWPSPFRLGHDGIYRAEDKGNGEFIDT